MNKREKELSEKGYSFTGMYSRNKESVLENAVNLRKNGFYAQVVTVSSRGRGKMTNTGYRVWAKVK